MTEVHEATLGYLLDEIASRFGSWGECAVGERFKLGGDNWPPRFIIETEGFSSNEATEIIKEGNELHRLAVELHTRYLQMQVQQPKPKELEL